ncbi:PDDEXK-like family protein [Ochrobactrum sp. A-1]|uniref:PDDEXK-like family protein n=1 Tax=Ochrobactrum sp. A-1 TaxID=2920940 RepID=UPI001F0ADC0A|nr:PD-(D/E)XK nuclease family protein [Ochrobactrum sp. A-1]
MSNGTGEQYEPSYDELEQLFVNNQALSSIEKHLNKFNPIKVMKMQGMEIRHSAILAWLLDPQETHSLADSFLKAFLAEALRGHGHKSPNAIRISQADLRDAEVRCEWNNIDIFILSPQNRWAFIIENKVYSSQRKDQLSGYRQRIEQLYSAQATDTEKPLEISGIFLTLNDEAPEDSEYVAIRYEAIGKFLELYLTNEAYQLQPEVTTFLTHYLHVLEELMGKSTERSEMEKLARQLYRDHRKVLDFILEHGAASDFVLATHSLFGDNPEHGKTFVVKGVNYVYTGLNARTFSFIPESWYEALGQFGRRWKGCEDWWAGLPLICWVEIGKHSDKKGGFLKLTAEVGPVSNYQFRKTLIESIEAKNDGNQLNISFSKAAKDEGAQFSRFLRRNTISIEDIQNSEEIFVKTGELMNKFKAEFDAVAQILPEFLENGEAKNA